MQPTGKGHETTMERYEQWTGATVIPIEEESALGPSGVQRICDSLVKRESCRVGGKEWK
jgi:hypothetical protein